MTRVLIALVAVMSFATTAWAQATGDDAPGWYRRSGEGAFTLRQPLRELYLVTGAHAGVSQTTKLEDVKGCSDPNAFFIGCANTPPSDTLGVGRGGSIGVGTRLTPALRTALIVTGEAGYRFHNSKPWVDVASGQTFVETFDLHSVQFTTSGYLDVGGLLAPGALGRWNPYLVGGLGLALNSTGGVNESNTIPGASPVTNTYPGSTRASLVWTVGTGVQYRFANGIVADLSYQYVDAGPFRAADGRPQMDGTTGSQFATPFSPIRGELRTHRAGIAINVDFKTIGRFFGIR